MYKYLVIYPARVHVKNIVHIFDTIEEALEKVYEISNRPEIENGTTIPGSEYYCEVTNNSILRSLKIIKVREIPIKINTSPLITLLEEESLQGDVSND